MAWLLLLLLLTGRPLFYWGALPPVVAADGLRDEARAGNAVEVHAARDRGDLVLRFGFERPVHRMLALADGTPVSGRLAAVLYIDADDDARTGLELDPADARTGADQRFELGVVFVGEDPSEGRKAIMVVALVLMPVAACVVASGGWVGKALVHAGVLPSNMQASEAFFITAEFLSRPGLFGLIMAALTAALMSTVDTLITAVAAIVVNDIYKPYLRARAGERELFTLISYTSQHR